MEPIRSSNEPLRVLVVDDSAYNRKSISEILTSSAEVSVVGKAADGDEALRLVGLLNPDVITLDLEMPRMNGFTFLRILMGKMPKPVIVVSSYSHKENVFKALELGAIDFVAKPDRYADSELGQIRQDLLAKVLLVRGLRPTAVTPRSLTEERPPPAAMANSTLPPRHVIAIACSTGGPTALLEILSKLPQRTSNGILVAQHMPAKFTKTFADRLNRRSQLNVSEARDSDEVIEGAVFICPGSRCMELVPGPTRGALALNVVLPAASDRYVPSADRLFTSVARVAGARAVGVVLTGMGEDGVRGARAITDAGGVVVVESEKTAVVHGMPGAVLRAGVPQRTLLLDEIAEFLTSLGS
jgi:two-component system chemotaxis response regulator CheB